MTMTSFANLAMVGRVSTPNPPTKPKTYDFHIRDEKTLESFCKYYNLTDEEKQLLKLTEIDCYPLNQIAEILGVTRQCVFQKRRNLYRRTIEKQAS